MLAVFTIVSADMSTVTVQRGSVPPAGQLLPAVAEVTVLVRTPLPVSGLSTVTE
jgi:hypothetical protein